MGDQHFTFLGCRSYDLTREGDQDVLQPMPGSGLGLLRNAPEAPSRSFADLPPEIRARAREQHLLVLTKANRRSTIHRPTYLDYVGVRRFDEHGTVIGEHRFLGLFTSSAYNSNPIDVPLLRRKVAAVIERAGFLPASHDQKDLIAILETYPRDDLFQISTDALFANAMGILRLQERRQVRMFVSREIYGRFISCMVFLPRDRYTTPVRLQISQILTDAFRGSHEWNVRLGESVLARLHFVFHVDPRDPTPDDLEALERRIAAATRAWVDDLRDALVGARGEEDGLEVLHQWGEAFPAAYRDDFDAEKRWPTSSCCKISKPGGTRGAARRSRRSPCRPEALRRRSPTFPLRRAPEPDEHGRHRRRRAPVRRSARGLEPAGSSTSGCGPGRTYATGGAGRPVRRRVPRGARAATPKTTAFNRLVLLAGLVVARGRRLLRAYSRYLRQIGTLFSQTYIANTLAAAPRHRAAGSSSSSSTRLDPLVARRRRRDADRRSSTEITAALDAVDEPRRRPHPARAPASRARDAAHERFQTGDDGQPRPCVVLKLDPAQFPTSRCPRPMFEIFVYSPRVEGVHLRAGHVLRAAASAGRTAAKTSAPRSSG